MLTKYQTAELSKVLSMLQKGAEQIQAQGQRPPSELRNALARLDHVLFWDGHKKRVKH